MTGVMTAVLIVLTGLLFLTWRVLRELQSLRETIYEKDEERPADKKRERMAKQWEALMAYGGKVNGEESDRDDD